MDTTIDLIALVVAITALLVTILQLRRTDRTTKTSARPHISITRVFKFDTKTFEVRMRNAGIGPAEISAFAIIVDGNVFSDAANLTIVNALADIGLANRRISSMFWYPGDVLGVAEESEVLILADMIPAHGISLADICDKIEVRVEYRSFHGDRYAAVSKQKFKA